VNQLEHPAGSYEVKFMSLKLGFVKSLSLFSIATMMILLGGELITAQTSSFTYQGHLIDGGTAAN